MIRAAKALLAGLVLAPLLTLASCGPLGFGAPDTGIDEISFNQHVRPILNGKCIACHGGVTQQGGISYLFREEALGEGRSGRRNVVPGSPRSSELIARITAHDPEIRMPYKGEPLSEQEIAILTQWIDEGAEWEEHWSFVTPVLPQVPEDDGNGWARNAIDHFVIAGLKGSGLEPSGEADKAALLRRVSLDLTGLPPTVEELDAFLADTSPDAYDKVVDRLLASEHFGERWAANWLDLARYADSRGYERDYYRDVWPYRDWVVSAFNANMPYNEFVVKQLAGDLLPDPTAEDIIATTFHRLTPANDEGGTDDEEFRVVSVLDRVATTWSALNGVTMECVQCHAHPYDPIRHEEYYAFMAFLNTTQDADRRDEFPLMHWPNDRADQDTVYAAQQALWDGRDAVLSQIRRAHAASKDWRAAKVENASFDEGAALEGQIDLFSKQLAKATAPWQRKRFSTLRERAQARLDEIRAEGGAPVPINLATGQAAQDEPVPPRALYSFTASPGTARGVTAIHLAIEPFEPETTVHTPEGEVLLDGLSLWHVAADGERKQLEVRYFLPSHIDGFNNQMQALRNANSDGLDDGFRITHPALQVHRLFQPTWSIAVLEEPADFAAADSLLVELENPRVMSGQSTFVNHASTFALATSASQEWPELGESYAGTVRELFTKADALAAMDTVTVPVMQEQPAAMRRASLVFERGNYLAKTGEALSPRVPAAFGALPEGEQPNRLTMARWFFNPEQPLTARVAVNRYWQQLFGIGLVETLEDFGSIGMEPSHPELLDWLAVTFQQEMAWDTKAFLKLVVTSATYRQSAVTSPEASDIDPRNLLLSRGPRQRLTAEMVRDAALASSGLLVRALGGPPVMPPQPEGLWNKRYPYRWENATGPDRFRRGIYTFMKRGATYPAHITFDGTDRLLTLPRRMTTNTPLQALVTLNDVVFQEAATALGDHMAAKARAHSGTTAEKSRTGLQHGAKRVLSRELSPAELAEVEALFADRNGTLADGEAWKSVGLVLLNLDAAMVR